MTDVRECSPCIVLHSGDALVMAIVEIRWGLSACFFVRASKPKDVKNKTGITGITGICVGMFAVWENQ